MLLLVLPIALVILAACGGSGPDAGSASPLTAVDFETCSGFLDLAQVAEAAGRDDVTVADRNPNSGPADGPITALCVIEFVTPNVPGESGPSRSGPSLNLLVLQFATGDEADGHHRRVAGEIRSMREIVDPDAALVEDSLGSGSYAVTLNEQGVGSVLGFREGNYVVQFNATSLDGAEALVKSEQIESLARRVKANLTGR